MQAYAPEKGVVGKAPVDGFLKVDVLRDGNPHREAFRDESQ